MKLPRSLVVGAAGAWLNTLHRVAPGAARAQALSVFCSPTKRGPPAKRHDGVLASAERRVVTLGGTELMSYRWPQAATDAGRPVVMLAHGWESCIGRLADWIAPLHRAGFDVVGIDAPAHGESSGSQLTAVDYANALHYLASEQPAGVAAVIGHSFGGLCAALAAGGIGVTAPLTARKLVLIAAPTSVAALTERYATLLSLRASLMDEMAALINERTGVPLQDFDAVTALEGTSLPVLVVHDTRDEEVPYASNAERLVKASTGAELYTTTGLGHRSVARNPHVIRYVVDRLVDTLGEA